jgi:hypothetical protein
MERRQTSDIGGVFSRSDKRCVYSGLDEVPALLHDPEPSRADATAACLASASQFSSQLKVHTRGATLLACVRGVQTPR